MGLFSRKPKTVLITGHDDVPVAGTSRRQKRVPPIGRFRFELRSDAKNKFDGDAVAVYAGRHLVGFLPRGSASSTRAAVRRAEKAGQSATVDGEVRQGETGRWILLDIPER